MFLTTTKIVISLIFYVLYYKVRKEQMFERRASLRSSIRSNKYAINTGALTAGSQSNVHSMYGSRSECKFRVKYANTL